MISVFVNMGAVILGSALGLLLKKGIPERVQRAVMTAIGLCTLYIGVSGALQGSQTIVLIVSMVFGTFLGTLIDIDGKIEHLSRWLEAKFRRKDKKTSLAEGFMTGSLLFCVGAMSIVGSLNAGLKGDNTLIYTKSILDLISACMLTSTLGIGVMLASLFILVYQGALVLLAGVLQNALQNAALVNEINCCGSVMIIALGLNLIGVTKIKVANLLPALLFVPLVFWLVGFLPI